MRDARRFAGFLLALWSLGLNAQQYVFTSYQQADGLSNLSVQGLALDRHDFLWVATQNGLYRFLGSGFQRIDARLGITEQEISDVYASPDGNVWAGTSKNLYRWTGESFMPAGPAPISIPDTAQLVEESHGHLLVIDRGILKRLVYDQAGSLAYEIVLPEALTSAHPLLKRLASIGMLADGALWMGCGRHLCVWRNGQLAEWGVREGVPDEAYRSMFQDKHGSLWAVGGHHVLEMPRGKPIFQDRTPPTGDPSRYYSRLPIAMDREGRMLISAEGGVARWENAHWRMIGERNGLRSSHITAAVFDANGDLWLGSTGHGLHHWTGYDNWEGWSERQGLPSANTWSVGAFHGSDAYVGTEKGPARVDLQTGEAQPLFNSSQWTYGQVDGMLRDRDDLLWAATKSGAVLRIQPETRQVTQVAAVPAYIYGMVPDPDGIAFVLTNRGLYRLDSPTPGVPPVPVKEAADALGAVAKVYGGCSAGSASWFATNRGLLQRRNGRWSRPAIDGFGGPLASVPVISNCSVDESFWIADDQDRIWRMMPSGDHLRAVQLPLRKEDRSLALLGLHSDEHGRLWVGTDNGLLAWNGFTWRHLTQESGLIWNDINSSGLASGPDGSIWIGTSGGLGHIVHPEGLFGAAMQEVSMIDIQRGTKALPLPLDTPLPWSRSDLSFHFAMPSALDRSDLSFRYRIPELQSTWTETRETTAYFAALPAGKYTFEVSAHNQALSASSNVLDIGFTILPPWWGTRWFYALCGTGLALLLYAFYNLRTRHLVRQRTHLEAVVRERTRELEESQEKLKIQATHDGLTGLLNHATIMTLIDREIERSRRDKSALAIILIDLDHFKRINDTHGHLAGDEALRQFALALMAYVRPYDYAGRYGGEEFALVLTGILASDVEARLVYLHSIISNLTVRYGEAQFLLTCSMGAVYLNPSIRLVDRRSALERADRALYEAKHAGRNRFVYRSLAWTPNKTSEEGLIDQRTEG